MSDKSYFEKLLTKDEVKRVLQELRTLTHENKSSRDDDTLLLLTAQLNSLERDRMQGVLGEESYRISANRIRASAKSMVNRIFPEGSAKISPIRTSAPSRPTTIANSEKNAVVASIFISYNHKDRSISEKIKRTLESSGFTVVIDFESIQPGEDIYDFIKKSVRETDATLSIVSKNSLLSSWVALESMKSFYAQEVIDRKFIPAYIDKSFLNNSFTDESLYAVQGEITEITERIETRLKKGWNFDDLNTDLKRYKDLEYNLPGIIDRIKTIASVDLTEKNYQQGIERIISSLR
ncbi:MAG: TIR domain-containing protein [Bacteroidota bacterium]